MSLLLLLRRCWDCERSKDQQHVCIFLCSLRTLLSRRTEYKAEASREAAAVDPPPDVLRADSPAGGWSEPGLCLWPVSGVLPVCLALSAPHKITCTFHPFYSPFSPLGSSSSGTRYSGHLCFTSVLCLLEELAADLLGSTGDTMRGLKI